MKSTIKTPRPRNPLVAAARFRVAGAHRRSNGGRRQQANRSLRAEISQSAQRDDACSSAMRDKHSP